MLPEAAGEKAVVEHAGVPITHRLAAFAVILVAMSDADDRSSELRDALARAEQLLPGVAAPEGEHDPRWQALIAVGELGIEHHPEDVWSFIVRWGNSDDEDLRNGIATCLLEHLLESHFALIFPRLRASIASDARYANTFARCWKLGQALWANHSHEFDELQRQCRVNSQ